VKAAIDNDILFKGACYGLLSELIATACSATEAVGTLGSARFVVAKKIEKNKLLRNRQAALAVLFDFLNQSKTLEPTINKQNMAADFELTAQRLGVNLDSGESQLCAMLVFRVLPLLLTGDKRAMTAMEKLIDADTRLTVLCGKVRCLEQLVYDALAKGDHVAFRTAVCAEPEVDKALAICFGCRSQSAELASTIEGLQSYVKALRAEATRVLSI
jgi:hypothetical protein